MSDRGAAEIGVGVIGVLNGAWNLLFGFVALGLGGFASSLGAEGAGAEAGVRGIFLLVLGLGMLVAAGGLFSSQPWGWTAAMAAWGAASLKSVYGIAAGDGFGMVALVVLVLNVGIVGVALSRSDGIGVAGSGEPSPYGD